MILQSLEVTQFRNIAHAAFHPSPELTVICGKNGQGKTNLLESIWLLTGGKSFRGAKDAELIAEQEPFSVIEGVVTALDRAHESRIRLLVAGAGTEKKGRTAKVNDVDYGRATNLAGVFTAVVFEPGHLSLVKGSPEGRRRFLDAALCQLYPFYVPLYRRYTRLVTQKNALLKQAFQTPNADDLLDVFDADLARCGMELSEKRQAYFALLCPEVSKIYGELSSGAESLYLHYEACYENNNLQEVIRQSRKRDLAAGFCTVGPHREDFTVMIEGRDAKTYGSQGQQRSAVLSLKLAEAVCAQQITEEHPVMLLDDVLSELDDVRQAYLLHRIEGRQTIVTACNADLFAKTNGAIYKMERGVLTQKA